MDDDGIVVASEVRDLENRTKMIDRSKMKQRSPLNQIPVICVLNRPGFFGGSK